MFGSSPFAASPIAAESGFILLESALAVQETGSDTYVGSLSANVSYVLVVQENTAEDFATGSAISNIGADLVVTDTSNSDSFQSTLTTFRNFALVVTEVGEDTSLGLMTVAMSSTLITAETGFDVMVGDSGAAIKANLLMGENSTDTSVGSIANLISGSLVGSETGEDVYAGSVDADDTAYADMALLESGSDLAAGLSTLRVISDLVTAEVGTDTFAAATSLKVLADLAVQDVGQDTGAGVSVTGISFALVANENEAPDSFTNTSNVAIGVEASVSEAGADSLAGTGQVSITSDMATVETGEDVFTATAGTPLSAALTYIENANDVSTGQVSVLVNLSSWDAQENGADNPLGSGKVELEIDLNIIEPGPDLVTGSMNALLSSSFITQEGSQDTFESVTSVSIVGAGQVTEEGSDSLSGDVGVIPQFTFALADTGADTLVGTFQANVTVVTNAQEDIVQDAFTGSAILDLANKRARAVRLVGKPTVYVTMAGSPTSTVGLIGKPSAALSILGYPTPFANINGYPTPPLRIGN